MWLRTAISLLVFVLSFVGIGVLVSEFLDKNYWYTAGMFGFLIANLLAHITNGEDL